MRYIKLHTAVLGTAVFFAPGMVFAQTTAQLSDKDKAFLSEAGEGGLKEMQFSKLALDKSKNDSVKSYAQQMITDHTQLNSDMQPFVQQAGLTPPAQLNAKDQAEYDHLSKLSGTRFDQMYIRSMQKDHHKTLQEFKTESTVATDPNFKSTVENGEKVIKQHTDTIDGIAKKSGGAPQSSNSTSDKTGF